MTDMNTKGTQNDKSGALGPKAATVQLKNGDEIDATHYIRNDGWVAIYTGDRADGIDYRYNTDAVRCIDTSDEVSR